MYGYCISRMSFLLPKGGLPMSQFGNEVVIEWPFMVLLRPQWTQSDMAFTSN